ncbi:MAG: DUF4174 domain-containing protein [Bacteroidota bacterium]
MQNPLNEHLWKERVLIITASSPTNVGYRKQNQALEKGKKGIKERELVVYRLYADHWYDPDQQPLTENQANEIHDAYDIDRGTFSVVLIGKDGTVKMRKQDVVSTRDIFQLIDGMPMRRQEMRLENMDEQ